MVAAAGASTLKRMNLELGGKTPMIVFDDATSTPPSLCWWPRSRPSPVNSA